MNDVKREIKTALKAARAKARHRSGRSTVSVAGRVNRVVVTNVGGDGSVQGASSTQSAPIEQST